MASRKTGVLYLQKDKFQLYSPNLGNILEFRFVPEIVQDLDVVNKELFESVVKLFITNGKIQPLNLLIVLADNTLFIKDFAVTLPQPAKAQNPKDAQKQPVLDEHAQKELHEHVKKFVDHVPFEEIASTTIPLKNGMRAVAANADLFNGIKSAFEKQGFAVESVIPGFLYGNNLSAQPAINGQIANLFIQKAGAFKQNNLLLKPVEPVSEKKKEGDESDSGDYEIIEEPAKPQADKKRLYLMVGVLGILLVVLVIVYMMSAQSTPPKKKIRNTAIPTKTAVSSPGPTVVLAGTVSPQDVKDLTVQIVTSSTSSSTATFRDALTKFGFKSVSLLTQGVSSSQTLVTFTPDVEAITRNAILEQLRKITTNFTVQEKSDAAFDISIILGK